MPAQGFHVLTNRKRLDAFIAAKGKISDLALGVGILSGKPKYDPGHVGRRSRDKNREGHRTHIDPRELTRRQYIRTARAHISEIKDPAQRKMKIKELRAQFRAHKLSSRGLARAVTTGTAVARVAGVLNSPRSGHVPYHRRAMEQHKVVAQIDLERVEQAMIRTGRFTDELNNFGRHSRDAVRRSLESTGHIDTGKLYRNTQYQITSRELAKQWREQQRAARAAKKRRRR